MKKPEWLTWKRIETLIWIGVLIWAGQRVWPQLAAAVGAGSPIGVAPAFTLEAMDGTVVHSEDLAGKVVLVNFWATWCTPCRLEMPALQKLHAEKESAGLVVLGISQDRGSRGGVAEFLAERDITYPVAYDTREIERAFGGVSMLPTTFLIDRRGVIRHQVFGFFAPPALRAAIGRLLDEEAPAAS